MIALDTNVLVRYLVRDHAEQAEAARSVLDALTAENPGFVCREVLVELVWVLERSYRIPRIEISGQLLNLVGADALVVESAADVARAALTYREGLADFSDAMILAAARRAAAHPLYTFDRRAAAQEGVQLLQASSLPKG